MTPPLHTPVMLDAALAALAPRSGGAYLDGTFGAGGYSRAILEAADCTVWAIDCDEAAVSRGQTLAAAFLDRRKERRAEAAHLAAEFERLLN